MNDDEDPVSAQELRREIAQTAHLFPEWERPSVSQRGLTGAEVIGILAAAGLVLGNIDKGLKSAEAIVERMKKLYLWCRGKSQGEEAPDEPQLGERERILVLLVDAYIRERQALSEARVAAVTGLAPAVCKQNLAELSSMGVVRSASDGGWMFVPH